MKDITKDQSCERADDLIAFLYGELTDWEARKFERHLHDCSACQKEYSTFGQLRKSIVAWRDESLGLAGERVFAPNVLRPSEQRRPSALAAMREFFNLSPLWLKGAAAFASVLFCVLAVLAFAHLNERPAPVVVQVQGDKVYSEDDLKARVAVAVQRSTDEHRQISKADAVAEPPKVEKKRSTLAKYEYAVRRPLSRQERQELAADLRLLTSKDDDSLDLVDDSINQNPK
jgi:hypothetical protein